MPKVVRLTGNLYGACFTLMKLLPARFIIDEMTRRGEIDPETTIVESTSGTFGLGLAIVCALRGQRLVLVSDPVLDRPLQRRLAELGARVEIVDTPAAVGGYQRARLDRLAEIRPRYAQTFVPSQYSSRLNPAAYAHVAALLEGSLGRIDYLVGCVGSGGSMCGTATALRERFPRLRAVAVDTHASVLFGLPDGPRALRGLGNSLMPANLDHTVFDEVHWVGAAEAFTATRRLHREHALFMGPTSGAAHLVARWLAAREPSAMVVALMPDEGHRYQDTVGDARWLAEHDLLLDSLPSAPRQVGDQAGVRGGWEWMEWNRRSLTASHAGQAI